MSDNDDSHLKLAHDDLGTATFKRGRAMEETFLISPTILLSSLNESHTPMSFEEQWQWQCTIG